MLAFVHIHKTAGTTVQWILRSSFGTCHCEVQPWDGLSRHLMPWQAHVSASDLRRSSKVYPHLESIGGHLVQPHTDLDKFCPGIKYFTFIRDPFKQRASMFQHGVYVHDEENLRLEDWLQEEQSSNRQTKMIAGKADVDAAIQSIRDKNIFVGLTDRFDESMLLLKSLVANDLKILYRPMRVASDNSIAQSLLSSAQTRQILAEGNKADMQLYDFIKCELYPTYQREYGSSLDDAVAKYRVSLEPFSRRGVSLSLLEKSFFHKLLLCFYLEPFDRRNVALSLLKNYFVYKPLIHLHRRGLSC
jgi:hypothetical protein